MKIKLVYKFEDIINIDNLLLAWQEFIRGKRSKKDVQEFSFRLMDNILQLHYDLRNGTYKHGGYQCFKINDPKLRTIHKASVRDRLLHHAVYRILYPFFDKKFIADSFSCRNDKGAHKAINRFREYGYIVSKNNTKTCWILKCDIKKFFASVDQGILIKILENHICHSGLDPESRITTQTLDSRFRGNDIDDLLKEIIFSFKPNGLPLGNLTSQLFANVYLNELDQFVKHELKVKYYIRYADDFVALAKSREYLKNITPLISGFLQNELKLILHPDKIFVKRLNSGIDFLGWVNFFNYRILRTKTKNRMMKGIKENLKPETINSYFGLLKHGKTAEIKKRILKLCG